MKEDVMSSDEVVEESHKSVVVPHQASLSRRVAAQVVKLAQRFRSDILLTAGEMHIDAKSTLKAFILLEALKGQTMELSARGADSALAVRDLSALFSEEGASDAAV
jgi:phosphotransferase system HPr (HPr) family protein